MHVTGSEFLAGDLLAFFATAYYSVENWNTEGFKGLVFCKFLLFTSEKQLP